MRALWWRICPENGSFLPHFGWKFDLPIVVELISYILKYQVISVALTASGKHYA
jgi:hypothetical protein